MVYIHNNFCHVGIFFAAALQCNKKQPSYTNNAYNHWVTHVNSTVLILKLNLTSLRNICIKKVLVEHHTHFNVYV